MEGLEVIFSQYGFMGIGVIGIAWYFRSINERMMNESKAREDKLMDQNEQRELRFIETINNITQNVSTRIDDIENCVTNIKTDINEIKHVVAPRE